LFRIPPLKAQNDYIFSKFGVHGHLGSPWLRLCPLTLHKQIGQNIFLFTFDVAERVRARAPLEIF